MRHSLIAKLIGFIFLYPLSVNSSLSQEINSQLLSTQLEEILNHQKYVLLKDLFTQKSFKQFNKQYIDFRNNYQDSQWSIKPISNHPEKTFLDVKIKARKKIGEEFYRLNSKQTVKIEKFKHKIKTYKVINEESILSTEKSPLVVEIISPKKVLTGERYEINLIIKKPLDNSLIASGMIVLKNNEKINISNDRFGLKPNQSGGLFKYIQAPLKPGYQTISAIITHPEGIYSITKRIKVGL